MEGIGGFKLVGAEEHIIIHVQKYISLDGGYFGLPNLIQNTSCI